MKTSKDAKIIILQVTNEFIRIMDFLKTKENKCKGFKMTSKYISYDVIILSELKNNIRKTNLNN